MPTQGKGHNLGIRNTCNSISAPYLLSSRNDFDEILVVMCRTQDNILAQGLGHNLSKITSLNVFLSAPYSLDFH